MWINSIKETLPHFNNANHRHIIMDFWIFILQRHLWDKIKLIVIFPFHIHTHRQETASNCLTIDGQPCVNGPWIWSEGPDIFVHFVNCIPMSGEGRNIFNLANRPNAIQGQDYEFYCPINLDNRGRVNKNRPDYFVDMKRCRLNQPEEVARCTTNKSLEALFSPKQIGTQRNAIYRQPL